MVDASCGQCGTKIDEEYNVAPQDRIPCPNCGSTTRNYSVSLQAAMSIGVVGLEATLTTRRSLLMQAVIIPGPKVSEGKLIEAVAVPWFEIVKLLEKDPAIAFQISPEKWEEIVAGAYKTAGFDKVVLTLRSGDFGRDVIAIKKGLGQVRVIDQVKAFNPSHLVDANDVRALMGVLQTDGASKGFVTTTSDFAPKIRSDPLINPLIPSRLELINGKTLLARLQELGRDKG